MPGLLLIALLFSSSAARAADFVFHLPPQWQKVESKFDGAYFRNRRAPNQMISAQKFPAPAQNFVARKDQKDIEAARAQFLKLFGLEKYRHLDIAAESGKLGETGLIHASYKGSLGQDVQMVELQYVINRELYKITYTEEAPALHDLKRVRVLLDQIRPNARPRGRMPASEIVNPEVPPCATCTAPPTAGASTFGFDMSLPENQERCKNVDPKIKRTTADNGIGLSALLGGGKTCAVDVVTGLYETAKMLIIATNPTLQAVYMFRFHMRMRNDPAFRAQVDSAALVAAEIARHPIDSTKRALASLLQLGNDTVKEFGCWKSEQQVKMACEVLSLLLVPPGGLLAKSLMRGARLTAEQIAFLSRAFRERAAGRAVAGDTRAVRELTETPIVAPDFHEKYAEWLNTPGANRAALIQSHLDANPRLADYFKSVAPDFPRKIPSPEEYGRNYVAYARAHGVPESEIIRPGVVLRPVDVRNPRPDQVRFLAYGEEVPPGFQIMDGVIDPAIYNQSISHGVIPMSWSPNVHDRFNVAMNYHEHFHAASLLDNEYRQGFVALTKKLAEPRNAEPETFQYLMRHSGAGEFFEDFTYIPARNHGPLNEVLANFRNAGGNPITATTPVSRTQMTSYIPESLLPRQRLQKLYEGPRTAEAQAEYREATAGLRKIVDKLDEAQRAQTISLGGAASDGLSMRSSYYPSNNHYNFINTRIERLKHSLNHLNVKPESLAEEVQEVVADLQNAMNRTPSSETARILREIERNRL